MKDIISPRKTVTEDMSAFNSPNMSRPLSLDGQVAIDSTFNKNKDTNTGNILGNLANKTDSHDPNMAIKVNMFVDKSLSLKRNQTEDRDLERDCR